MFPEANYPLQQCFPLEQKSLSFNLSAQPPTPPYPPPPHTRLHSQVLRDLPAGAVISSLQATRTDPQARITMNNKNGQLSADSAMWAWPQVILIITLWRRNCYSSFLAKQTDEKKSQINRSGHRARVLMLRCELRRNSPQRTLFPQLLHVMRIFKW